MPRAGKVEVGTEKKKREKHKGELDSAHRGSESKQASKEEDRRAGVECGPLFFSSSSSSSIPPLRHSLTHSFTHSLESPDLPILYSFSLFLFFEAASIHVPNRDVSRRRKEGGRRRGKRQEEEGKRLRLPFSRKACLATVLISDRGKADRKREEEGFGGKSRNGVRKETRERE